MARRPQPNSIRESRIHRQAASAFSPGRRVVEPRRGGGKGIGALDRCIACGERGLAPTFRTQQRQNSLLPPRSSQRLSASLATSSNAWACSCLDQPSHNAPGAQLFWPCQPYYHCWPVVVFAPRFATCSPTSTYIHTQLPAGRRSNNNTSPTYTAPRLKQASSRALIGSAVVPT
jgi:hypothetical protein